MDKSARLALLAGLDFSAPPKSGPPKPKKPAPARRRVHYIPGETRATVGVDGFRPMDVAAYRRKLYANSEPRNLTPPQFLSPSGGTTSERRTEHVPVGSDPHYPEKWRQEKTQLAIECATEKYLESFLLNLLTAQYRTWRIGGWTWREFTPNPITI